MDYVGRIFGYDIVSVALRGFDFSGKFVSESRKV